jgi:tannase/feruloyl esterase
VNSFLAVLLIGGALWPLSAAAATCESLASLSIRTTITNTEDIPAGTFKPTQGRPFDLRTDTYRTLPAFCRVQGVLAPTADSHIEFEVWLPTSQWNGRYLGVGNGGSGGFIAYASNGVANAPGLADALRDGFAASSTDTGHRGTADDYSFGIGHREKRLDYDYRAVHETAVAAKEIIRAYYGQRSHYSYFAGCSDGGRQALIEVQRYPADYDGVLACAPTASRTGAAILWTWVARALSNNLSARNAEKKIPVVQRAVVAACDRLDGLADGVIDDPTKCHFDLATLLCAGADSIDCLTAPEVAVFEKLYEGPPRVAGTRLVPGFPPGAETDPGGSLLCDNCMSGAGHRASTFFEGIFQAQFTVDRFDFDVDVRALEASEEAKLGNATEPDLTGFNARGGKLIIVHGWSDGTDSPLATINYYNSVVLTMGDEAVHHFLRLYMAPGMQHGGGGPGPNRFWPAMITALEDWAERGRAPGPVLATKYGVDGDPSSGIARTRWLCPYPERALYDGSGNVNDAKSFSCGKPPQ